MALISAKIFICYLSFVICHLSFVICHLGIGLSVGELTVQVFSLVTLSTLSCPNPNVKYLPL
ncbi:MAG: hypothetical protein F6K31_05925 [Symploca sp. SIO2G7]|nr:hypothetical protein [Symploca sp. SIO2G7]